MSERPSDDGLVCLDGAFVAPSEARISPFDHGFLYGDGVYETMRAYAEAQQPPQQASVA